MIVFSMWLDVVSQTEFIAMVIGVPTTLSLLGCIVKKSPKEFGDYRHFLSLCCYQSLLFGIFSCALGMNYYSNQNSVAAFATWNFLGLPASSMIILLCGEAASACMTIWSLAAQYLYRYMAMTKNPNLNYYFGGKRWMLWILGIFLISVAFAGNIYCFGPMLETGRTDGFENEIRDIFGMGKTEPLYYVRFKLYDEDGSGSWAIDKAMIGFAIMAVITGIPLTICIVCGVKTYYGFKAKTDGLNDRQDIQNTLFRALLIQTLIMTVFLYLPTFLNFTATILRLNLGTLSDIGGVSFVMYPMFDSILMLWIIKYYRKSVLNFVLCRDVSVAPLLTHGTATSYIQNRAESGV